MLLNEFKAAVLSFIQETKNVDFQQAQEVKQLYQRELDYIAADYFIDTNNHMDILPRIKEALIL